MRIDNRVVLSFQNNKEVVKHYEVGWFAISTDDVPFEKGVFEKFCVQGCKNFSTNGGCPPFAPSFNKLKKQYCNGVVVWTRVIQEHMPQSYFDGNNRNFFLLLSYLLNTLPGIPGYLRKNLFDLWGADSYLGESKCKVCGNYCSFRDGDKLCKFPQKRVFSLESTGVDVDLLMRIGAFPLYWYARGQLLSSVPYSTKVVMYLFREELPERDFTEDLVNVLNARKEYSSVSMERVFQSREGILRTSL